MGRKSSQPLVSVIIACKNTADYFRECLLSVEHQTYKNIEIIVVDNFSTDGTYEIAKKYADQVYQLGPERSTQFNFGFTKSKGEFIYRIGPDYKLEPDVIEKCVAKMAEGFDALALHNRSVGDSIWAKVRYYERESYRNDKTIVAARFMKRSVFKDLGMFDESLVAGEDFDLHNRLEHAGYKWSHVDAIENHIGEPKTVKDVWRKFYYYGRTIQRYRAKNKSIAGKQLVFFRPSFLKVQKDLLRHPILFFYFWIYMVVKHLAGAAGVLAGPPDSLPEVHSPTVTRNHNNPLVSIIVPTKNSYKNMFHFLDSFVESSYKNIEIIINDDITSSDDLEKLAKSFKEDNNLNILYLRENLSMAQGRFAGAERASGTYLFHLDSDMRVSKELISECVNMLEDKVCDAIVVPEKSIGDSFWANVKVLEKSMYEGVEQLESARFMRTKDYFKIGGHDKSLVFSEDKDLDIRIRKAGFVVGRVNNYLLHNEGSIKLINTLVKKLGYSATSSLFAEKNPQEYSWQINIFNRYWIFLKNWKKILSSPVSYASLFILKTLEYAFSFYGVMRRKVKTYISGKTMLFSSDRLIRGREKETRVLIVTHSTELHGSIDTFEEYLVDRKYPVYKLIHPLLSYKKMGTALNLNCKTLFSRKRRSVGILNLFLDFFISLRTALTLKPEVYMGANNFDTLSGIVAQKVFRKPIKKIIFFGTDFSEDRYDSWIMNKIYYLVERVAIRYSDTVISNTTRAETKRLQFGLTRQKSIVIPNGVKLENPKFVDKTIDPNTFIFVGAVTKEHGLYELIEKIHIDIKKLVILGSGDDLDRVLDLCKQHKVNLELRLNLPHKDTIDYLQNFKGIGLAPYNSSSMWTYYCSPLKIVEYVSCGVPVLMSALPEISAEIVENNLGVVFEDKTDRKIIMNRLKTADFSGYYLKSKEFYEKYSVDNLLNKVSV